MTGWPLISAPRRQLHRVRLDSGFDIFASQLTGHVVERFGDLHVPVIEHLRASVPTRAPPRRESARPDASR
jgi:hypothetical protein